MDNLIQNYYEWSNSINKYYLFIEDWYNKLYKLKNYIDTYNILPLKYNNDKTINELGDWLIYQQINYRNKLNIMKNQEIYNSWSQFINSYGLLKNNNEKWYNNLNKLKQYVNEHNKLPSKSNDLNEKKILGWLMMQKINYKKHRRCMKNPEIYNEWVCFINEYNKYFKTNKEIWYDNLNKLKQHINKYKKKPSGVDKNKDIRQIGQWLLTQKKNFKNNNQIMKDPIIYNKWLQFINEYHNI